MININQCQHVQFRHTPFLMCGIRFGITVCWQTFYYCSKWWAAFSTEISGTEETTGASRLPFHILGTAEWSAGYIYGLISAKEGSGVPWPAPRGGWGVKTKDSLGCRGLFKACFMTPSVKGWWSAWDKVRKATFLISLKKAQSQEMCKYSKNGGEGSFQRKDTAIKRK